MSASLLQKSLKLFEEEEKSENKGVRRNIQKHNKKKKQLIALSEQKEEIIKRNIQQNLEAIKILNHYSVSKEVSKKIIRHVVKADIPLDTKPREEATAFTDEDFKAFEDEYADEPNN